MNDDGCGMSLKVVCEKFDHATEQRIWILGEVGEIFCRQEIKRILLFLCQKTISYTKTGFRYATVFFIENILSTLLIFK